MWMGEDGISTGSDENSSNKQQKVCFHWRRGKCTRFPCPFLHSELRTAATGKRSQGFGTEDSYPHGGGMRRNYNFSNNNRWGREQPKQPVSGNRIVKKIEKLCNHWVQGRCKFGDNCKFLHQWSSGGCFSLLTSLEGHQQVVTGIALPTGSDKLYTGGQDETVRVWDSQSGQLAGLINVGGAVGCMLSEGPWVFVGLTNLVKDGTVLAWKFNVVSNCLEPSASLTGHTLAVAMLVVGGNRLYSGSMDRTIEVWSLETLQCLQTLSGHTDVVMSLLCWDQFLLSASLDKTVKVWAATEAGNLEVTYTHSEEHGILALCGMHDSEAKPMLLCSCNDNCMQVYDLPSFSERGKIFLKKEMRAIQLGPGGLFFTGDGSGQVRVWKWLAEGSMATS